MVQIAPRAIVPLKDLISVVPQEPISRATSPVSWARRARMAGRTLGSFEHWAQVMGGILECAGIEHFLGNLGDFYDRLDAEGCMWREFCEAAFGRFAGRSARVTEYNELCAEKDLLLPVLATYGLTSPRPASGSRPASPRGASARARPAWLGQAGVQAVQHMRNTRSAPGRPRGVPRPTRIVPLDRS